MEEKYIAHMDGNRMQTVEDHLHGVGVLAGKFASPIGLSKEAELIGRLHDIGKYQTKFLDYITGKYKGRVDHSTIGAKLFFQKGDNLGLIGAFCIAGHHCGLQNLLPNNGSGLIDRIQKEFPEYDRCVSLAGERLPATNDNLDGFFDNTSPNKDNNKGMDLMLLTRMLYSCLVDADFLDTEAFMTPGEIERGNFSSMEELYQRFWGKLETMGFFKPKNELNKKRLEILKTCKQKGEKAPGLYTLTVPTGGGKTISSLAFALEQAARYHKERIIYVIPYTSIIDQTADVFKSILGEENVLENHCQVSYDYDEESVPKEKALTMQKLKLAAENWDHPVIVTTNEQFFESLFANRSSKCRKLHNIMDSIIIMDECQMLPVDFLTPTLRAIEELVSYYKCSAVLCSATQPRLDKYLSIKPKEIMDDINSLYGFFTRVSYVVDGECTYKNVAKALSNHTQSLCVAATIKDANEIYKVLPADLDGKYYLSTRLCSVHRKQVINEIKERLVKGLPCHVVSTSIISVGVDVDFPAVYLQYGGLDSLIQGAGRCNREGKHNKNESIAHIFWTEASKKSPFMAKGKQASDAVLHAFEPSLLSQPEAVDYYYTCWYRNNEGSMDKAQIIEKAKKFAFSNVAKSYRLISDNTKSVFIPLNKEAKEILYKLNCGIRTRNLLRKASKYMVNIRCSSNKKQMSDFDMLLSMGTIEMFQNDESLAYLVNEAAYDPVMGLKIVPLSGQGFLL